MLYITDRSCSSWHNLIVYSLKFDIRKVLDVHIASLALGSVIVDAKASAHGESPIIENHLEVTDGFYPVLAIHAIRQGGKVLMEAENTTRLEIDHLRLQCLAIHFLSLTLHDWEEGTMVQR